MLDRIALIILIIGGLNWGSVGLFKYDPVSYLFGGSAEVVTRVIFSGGYFLISSMSIRAPLGTFM